MPNPLLNELVQRAMSPEVDTQNYPPDLDPQLLEILQMLSEYGIGTAQSLDMGMMGGTGMGMPTPSMTPPVEAMAPQGLPTSPMAAPPAMPQGMPSMPPPVMPPVEPMSAGIAPQGPGMPSQPAPMNPELLQQLLQRSQSGQRGY